MIAADDQIVQLGLAHAGGINRHAAASASDNNDIIAVEFDPRRELMFWIDSQKNKIYRSAIAKGLCPLVFFYHGNHGLLPP